MYIIDVDKLSFTYPAGRTAALDNVSLHIEQGEFIGLIGANNAGKSSLCLAMTGAIPHLYQGQMDGCVRVDGKNIAQTSVAETAAAVGFVMQQPENQLSGVCFTVREEVAFSLENRGVDRNQMVRRVNDALHATGLADLADRSPHQLSGGQLQRVILASALAGDAPILVLDEPTTFLDPQSAGQLFEILRQLRDTGKTIVIAEQRLECLAQYANRVIALHQGKKVLDGPSQTTLTSPLLKEIGLDWTRFTAIANLAKKDGLWPSDRPLPATLDDAANGLGGK